MRILALPYAAGLDRDQALLPLSAKKGVEQAARLPNAAMKPKDLAFFEAYESWDVYVAGNVLHDFVDGDGQPRLLDDSSSWFERKRPVGHERGTDALDAIAKRTARTPSSADAIAAWLSRTGIVQISENAAHGASRTQGRPPLSGRPSRVCLCGRAAPARDILAR